MIALIEKYVSLHVCTTTCSNNEAFNINFIDRTEIHAAKYVAWCNSMKYFVVQYCNKMVWKCFTVMAGFVTITFAHISTEDKIKFCLDFLMALDIKTSLFLATDEFDIGASDITLKTVSAFIKYTVEFYHFPITALHFELYKNILLKMIID